MTSATYIKAAYDESSVNSVLMDGTIFGFSSLFSHEISHCKSDY
jgi:hypothetical protein